ncbi:hypothetical protein BDU57DRAFT_118237 [Ampelomyces quisqualis]|uniref:Secreted protein n=1 Tax=Ampelomyces quisqualis TaxID=50730 RepID=A0A6A5QTI6_AMPQU|nr:hypothetical protein BDU57DRAFT_118237 [Ampelomyces quisqualis]
MMLSLLFIILDFIHSLAATWPSALILNVPAAWSPLRRGKFSGVPLPVRVTCSHTLHRTWLRLRTLNHLNLSLSQRSNVADSRTFDLPHLLGHNTILVPSTRSRSQQQVTARPKRRAHFCVKPASTRPILQLSIPRTQLAPRAC